MSTTTETTPTPIRFTRTDLSDGAEETLTLVTLPEGKTLLSGAPVRPTQYAVLVEAGDDAWLYDLDAVALPAWLVSIRDCTPATSAPADVIDQIEAGWATGLKTVERVIPDCHGHPAGPFDPMGTTVYCDGSCR